MLAEDLHFVDEIKVYKDEGDEEELKSSENLSEEKKVLVTEGESQGIRPAESLWRDNPEEKAPNSQTSYPWQFLTESFYHMPFTEGFNNPFTSPSLAAMALAAIASGWCPTSVPQQGPDDSGQCPAPVESSDISAIREQSQGQPQEPTGYDATASQNPFLSLMNCVEDGRFTSGTLPGPSEQPPPQLMPPISQSFMENLSSQHFKNLFHHATAEYLQFPPGGVALDNGGVGGSFMRGVGSMFVPQFRANTLSSESTCSNPYEGVPARGLPPSSSSRSSSTFSPHPRKTPNHIKKPLNAFMLFMKVMRPKVQEECTLKESAAINQMLGKKWHELSRQEQAKFYDLARKEKALHAQRNPGWSARENYALHQHRRKRRLYPSDQTARNGSDSEPSSGSTHAPSAHPIPQTSSATHFLFHPQQRIPPQTAPLPLLSHPFPHSAHYLHPFGSSDATGQNRHHFMSASRHGGMMQHLAPHLPVVHHLALAPTRPHPAVLTVNVVTTKKCRARFGLERQHQWCKPCRRKKKCQRFLSDFDDLGGEGGEGTTRGSDGPSSPLSTSPSDPAMVHKSDSTGLGQPLNSSSATLPFSIPQDPTGPSLPLQSEVTSYGFRHHAALATQLNPFLPHMAHRVQPPPTYSVSNDVHLTSAHCYSSYPFLDAPPAHGSSSNLSSSQSATLEETTDSVPTEPAPVPSSCGESGAAPGDESDSSIAGLQATGNSFFMESMLVNSSKHSPSEHISQH